MYLAINAGECRCRIRADLSGVPGTADVTMPPLITPVITARRRFAWTFSFSDALSSAGIAGGARECL